MANPNRVDKEDWEFEFFKVLARRFPGVYREVFRPDKSSVLVGAVLSIRPWRGQYLATVKGDRVDGGGMVIAFGAGDSASNALRNVSAACQKGEYKRDQFAQPIGDRGNHVSAEKPAPLGLTGYGVGADFQPPLDLAK